LPALTVIVAAAAAFPVAVNVTGLPLNPPTAAVRVFVPAELPNVHDVSVAMPDPFVFTVLPLAGDVEPPPPVTVNVTAVPDTALPFTSRTSTDGAVPTEVLTVAL
jgi:hypothetical protein